MIRKILVTDDGPGSNRAFDTASDIAGPCNAQIILLHVIDSIEIQIP